GGDLRLVLTLHGPTDLLARFPDRRGLGGRRLVLVLLERLLSQVHHLIALVLELDQRPALLVVDGMRLRLMNHLLDLVLLQTARCRDLDLLLAARRPVLRTDVD